jgi:hypothetical protein
VQEPGDERLYRAAGHVLRAGLARDDSAFTPFLGRRANDLQSLVVGSGNLADLPSVIADRAGHSARHVLVTGRQLASADEFGGKHSPVEIGAGGGVV